jgi:hypothetical protein
MFGTMQATQMVQVNQLMLDLDRYRVMIPRGVFKSTYLVAYDWKGDRLLIYDRRACSCMVRVVSLMKYLASPYFFCVLCHTTETRSNIATNTSTLRANLKSATVATA